MNHPFALLLLLAATLSTAAPAATDAMMLKSPDGHLSATLHLADDQTLRYTVQRDGRPVLLPSRLGLRLEGADLSTGLMLVSQSPPRVIDERYEMQVGKKRQHHHRAIERDHVFANATGRQLQVTLRVADDGVAFRYRVPAMPGAASALQQVQAELTSLRFAPTARAWLQPMSVAKTGWMRSNPAYEEHYLMDVPVGTACPMPAGWVFPALFRSGDDWVALSEAGMDGRWHGSRLQADSAGGEYRIGGPPPEEVFPGGALLAQARGELVSPWRLLAVGSLKTLVESTLGTDLAAPAVAFDPTLVKPGLASWSWALLKDEHTVYDEQKRFIDYAADMHWDYTLVDADWDRRIGDERVKELVTYAAAKGVGLLLWYNSAGSWNDTPYTPRDRLLTHELRATEFRRLREMGVKGVKVDFFGGDGASMLAHYLGILDDAAQAGLLVNFHGATLPRGWARTYPNLMTAEAVRGLEFTTFTQRDQDLVASHAVMLPFTRNLFDPMDFTPMVFGEIPNIIRSTRNGFELAEAVLFISGIQHFAEVPEGMARVPAFVKQLLQTLPRRWDDVHFVDGLPGRFVVIARRAGNTWYVAGQNAGHSDAVLTLDLSFLEGRRGRIITDGPASSRELIQQDLVAGPATALRIKPRGGFVAVFGP